MCPGSTCSGDSPELRALGAPHPKASSSSAALPGGLGGRHSGLGPTVAAPGTDACWQGHGKAASGPRCLTPTGPTKAPAVWSVRPGPLAPGRTLPTILPLLLCSGSPPPRPREGQGHAKGTVPCPSFPPPGMWEASTRGLSPAAAETSPGWRVARGHTRDSHPARCTHYANQDTKLVWNRSCSEGGGEAPSPPGTWWDLRHRARTGVTSGYGSPGRCTHERPMSPGLCPSAGPDPQKRGYAEGGGTCFCTGRPETLRPMLGPCAPNTESLLCAGLPSPGGTDRGLWLKGTGLARV